MRAWLLSIAPPTVLGTFVGPGACDNPGPGCLLGAVVGGRDPATGCGFPGSA